MPCDTDVSDKTDDRNVQDKEAIKHIIIGISLPGYKCPHIIITYHCSMSARKMLDSMILLYNLDNIKRLTLNLLAPTTVGARINP